MSKSMTLKPRLSEKAYRLSEAGRTYVFDVPPTANKLSVKAAVQAQFKVTVENVTTVIAKGKRKYSSRRGRRPVVGRRTDVKKAYVTLKEGDKLPLFAAIEEAAKEDKEPKEKN